MQHKKRQSEIAEYMKNDDKKKKPQKSKEDKDLIDYLRNQNVSQDILLEL